jgi:hypothetical protein
LRLLLANVTELFESNKTPAMGPLFSWSTFKSLIVILNRPKNRSDS